MKEETKKELLYCLKNRISIQQAAFDVHKILEVYGMKEWGKMCCNRIVDNELIDFNHVKADWICDPGHIFLDAVGIIKCEEILKAFISEKSCKELEDIAWKLHDRIASKNQLLDLLRSTSSKELRKILKKSKQDNAGDILCPELIKMELFSRHFYWKMYLRIKEFFEKKLFYIKHFQYVCIVKKVAKEAIRDIDSSQISIPKKDKKLVIMDAYMRFVDSHKGCVNLESLSHDDIKKFVFLGVNYFGKRPDRNNRIIPSAEDLESKFVQVNHVMQAIGMLTPEDLTQMFPIIKEYDGEKYGEKDYFYTLNALRKLNSDRPIGSSQDAAQLLWDYHNHSLSFFILSWLGCVEDLHVYANKSAEFHAFYDGLKSKHKNDHD